MAKYFAADICKVPDYDQDKVKVVLQWLRQILEFGYLTKDAAIIPDSVRIFYIAKHCCLNY